MENRLITLYFQKRVLNVALWFPNIIKNPPAQNEEKKTLQFMKFNITSF